MASYKTISRESTSEYKEKRSKFLGYAYPCMSANEADEILASVRELHPKASHHCYAYILGEEGDTERTWDDGEPSGTAGLPILYQIKSHECTYVIVIVVRYYGGKQLGASGLKNAYKLAARECLDANEIVEKEPTVCLSITADYEHMPELMNIYKRYPIEIKEQSIDTVCHWKVEVPKKVQENFSTEISKFCTFTTC